MKKIWIINHYATSMYENQDGRHFCFAKYLKIKNYTPIIICASAFHNTKKSIDTENKRFITKNFTKDNIDFDFVFIKTPIAIKNGFKRLYNMFIFYFNLILVHKKIQEIYGKPDIILASSVHPLTLIAGLKISKRMNIPCICEVRDLWPETLLYANHPFKKFIKYIAWILRKGEYWIYKKANAIIFTTEGAKNYIIEQRWDVGNQGKIDMKKVFYINNGVDLQNFSFQSTQCRSEIAATFKRKYNIIYTGSIRPANNIEILVQTADYLKNHEDIEFLIYGEGFQKEDLEKKAKHLNLNNIHFKGHVNKQEIPFILTNSFINILTYVDDTWNFKRGSSSIKLFDYLASGKPIISTNKMDYSIIEKWNCGIEIDNATPEKLGDVILNIKNLPEANYIKLCENAKNAANEFDFKLLTDKLINVINYSFEVF